MAKQAADRIIIEQLQRQIQSLQNQSPAKEGGSVLGLGELENAFPQRSFPRGFIHEFISYSSEAAACTSAFVALVLSKLMDKNRYCLWISQQPRRTVFPVALKNFGVDPERILFVDAPKSKETLWAIEEALKCNALAAVLGEISELSFEDSRRLQLAAERSAVTGFIHRFRPRTENATACVSRWKITPLASESIDGLPGLGFPRWDIDLVKVKNGKPAHWQIQYSPSGIEYLVPEPITLPETYSKQTA